MHLYSLERTLPFPAFLNGEKRIEGNDLASYEKAVDNLLEHRSTKRARLRLMVGGKHGWAILKAVSPEDEAIEVVFAKYRGRPHRIKCFFLESEPETYFDGTLSGLKKVISAWQEKKEPRLPTLVAVFEPRSPMSRPLWASVNLRDSIQIGFIHNRGNRRRN